MLQIKTHHLLATLVALGFFVAGISLINFAPTTSTAATGGSQTFSTPGTHTFTVPAVVTSINVVVIGGGGGGGGGATDWGGGGGGGCGGGVAGTTLAVSPGQQFSVTVGAGGNGGSGGAQNGFPGENSQFGSITANGGSWGGSGQYGYPSSSKGPGGTGGGSGGGGGGNAYCSGEWCFSAIPGSGGTAGGQTDSNGSGGQCIGGGWSLNPNTLVTKVSSSAGTGGYAPTTYAYCGGGGGGGVVINSSTVNGSSGLAPTSGTYGPSCAPNGGAGYGAGGGGSYYSGSPAYGGAGAPGVVYVEWDISADTTPPTVSITAPTNGATVSGSAVTISATATDDTGVAGVQFKVDGTNVGAEDTTSPYSISWDSTTVSSGTHTISAVARDAAGNSATASVSVTTSNYAAPSGAALTGYAWSDTIGWISLSGTTYGLYVASNGTLSGDAWSDNIGWISADSADLSGCPASPCSASLAGNALTGWMKALAGGSSQSGGWDGWISLSGTGYGPVLTAGNFSGYAWGSTVVGWVDFSLAHTTYDDSCTPATTYTCTPSSGYDVNDNSTIASTTISAHCQTAVTQTVCHKPQFCTAGSSTCLSSPPAFIQTGTENGHLHVYPQVVLKGKPVKLYWNVSNATCTVTGTNSQSWSTTSSLTTGTPTNNITQQTTFTLRCTGDDGSRINESVIVNILPAFQEK